MKLTKQIIKNAALSIALAAAGTGCGVVEDASESTDDEDADSEEGSILGSSTNSDSDKKIPLLFNLADLKLPSDVPESTESEMQDILFSGYHLENDGETTSSDDDDNEDDDDDDSEDEDNSCIEDQMDKNVIHATKNEFIYSVDLDMGKCFFDDEDDMTATFDVSSWKMLVYSKCNDSGIDISHLDGKSMSEIDDIDEELDDCSSSVNLMQTSSEVHGTIEFTIGDTVYSTPMHSKDISFEGNEDFEPCHATFASDELTQDGCQNIEISTNYEKNDDDESTDVEESHTYFKTTSDNVVTPEGSAWHKSGSFSVIINNWTGDVENSDEDTAPTYTMTSDSGDESTGTWGEFADDSDDDSESSLLGTIKMRQLEAVSKIKSQIKELKKKTK
jgi:hypothetical protein